MEDYLQEVGALTMRWVKRLSREKFSMVFTLFQPMVFWLIFFGNLFQRTANAEVVQAPSYIAFLAAGVVVMTILNNGLAAGRTSCSTGERLFRAADVHAHLPHVRRDQPVPVRHDDHLAASPGDPG